ncbi:MAG: bacteriorhodopsin, partial [Phormidesmis sp.]
MVSLWIGFIGLLIGAIYFGKDAITASGEDWEEFHIVHFTITAIAALAYLGMIMGQTFIVVYDHEVIWARYLDWALTTPLILFSLCRFGGVRGPILAGLLISNELMIATGLFAALSPPSAECVWYIVS